MKCELCPIRCGADLTKGAGRCGTRTLTVAKYYLHPYEEPPISHKNGSGTIFFSGCSLRCVFCQNWELSRVRRGTPVTVEGLTGIFRTLEDMGADNINLVTPDHLSDLIAEALALYRPAIPVVYNSSGYCLVESLEKIDPYIDVYLPDLKFFSPELSRRYTGREDYFAYAVQAIRYMAKKPVRMREDGKMLSGMIVRHLVLPMCTGDSLRILDFLKETLPEDVPVSIMCQYTPMGEIKDFPELNRRVTAREYRRVTEYAQALGFSCIYTQSRDSANTAFIPDWDEGAPI